MRRRASRAPNQGPRSSFSCRTAVQGLTKRECVFTDAGITEPHCAELRPSYKQLYCNPMFASTQRVQQTVQHATRDIDGQEITALPSSQTMNNGSMMYMQSIQCHVVTLTRRCEYTTEYDVMSAHTFCILSYLLDMLHQRTPWEPMTCLRIRISHLHCLSPSCDCKQSSAPP